MECAQDFIDGPRIDSMPGNWYAVHTRSNYEKKVVTQFGLRGITAYLPVWQEIRSWSDRRKVVEVPVFRGYVFARFEDSGRNRLHILQTPGVARIVGGCGDIEAIPDAEISVIQQVITSKVDCTLHPFVRVGDWVRVVRGPLEGVEGVFLRHKSSSRLVISVSLISQSVATEVDACDVQNVDRGGSQPVRIPPSRELWANPGVGVRQPAA
jgi:transcription antitermination factor NusG